MPSPVIDAERWRPRIRKYGEFFRFFPAVLCGCADPRSCSLCERDGRIYDEVTLADGVKAWFGETSEDIESTEYGVLFPKGSTQVTTMPDECFPQRLDRIVSTSREQLRRELVARSVIGDDDYVSRGYVVDVLGIRQGAEIYTPYDEELETGDYSVISSGIRWISNNRPVGSYAVEYRYHPLYHFMMPITQPWKDDYGVLMPMDGIVTEKLPTEGD